MAKDFDHRALTISLRIYQALLRAYPKSHRAEYGPAMAQLFRDQCRAAWSEARGWGLTKLWLRTVPDVVNTSIAEQIAAFNPRKSMTDKMTALFRPLTSPMWVFGKVFLTVFLLVLTISIAITFMLPESYASTAKIKVESETPAQNSGSGQSAYDPYFIQTEFEVIQSQLVLNQVIDQLDLKVKWGMKFFNGETLKASEVMSILKQRLWLVPVRNTQIIAITAYSEDRLEAASLANAVAEAYRDYRAKTRAELMAKGLAALQQQFESAETEIRELQTKAEAVRQQLNLASNAVASQVPAEQPYWELKRQLVQREDLHRLLGTKIQVDKLDAAMPKTLVQIIEQAEPGRRPVKPNKPLNIFIGAIAGGALGLIAGTVSALLSAKLGGRGRKPVAAG